MSDYHAFLKTNETSITQFKSTQQAAFEAERERWESLGLAHFSGDQELAAATTDDTLNLPPNCRVVASHVSGSLWQVKAAIEGAVKQGDTVLIVESMKMEINIPAPCDGVLVHFYCQQGQQITAGQNLFAIQMEI